MDFIHMKAELVSEERASLNEFLGSTVRGALISEISKIYCTSEDLKCTTCNQGVTCPNRVLFNMKYYGDSDKASNPIVINAKLKSDDCIELDIMLFGIGIMSAIVISDILKNGIKLGKERSLFVADAVYTVDDKGRKTPTIAIRKISPYYSEASKIKVVFKSPARIQSEFVDLTFEDFFKMCYYRYQSINRLVKTEPSYDIDSMLEQAKEVETTSKKLKRVNLERYSKHTNRKDNIYCTQGEIEFTGNITPFMPILKFVEHFNIGKWSSMGLGRISIKL